MLKQMSRFTTKYGRYVFFFLLVIVCISFVLTVEMISCNDPRGRNRVAGILFGEEVSAQEFEDVKDRWHACRRFMAYPQTLHEVVALTLDMKELKESYFRYFLARNFIQGSPTDDEMNAFTWRVIAFLHEAKRAGIVVTDAEVAKLVQDMFGGARFDQEAYLSAVEKELRIPVEAFERTMREALVLSRYYGFVQEGKGVKSEDIYNEYLQRTEKARVRSVKFAASDFEDRVRLAPTRHALRPVEEAKRPIVIDGDTIFAHYLREKNTLTIEPKVRLEYVLALYEAFRGQITPPTEPQMQERYELEKEAKYRIKTADRVHKPLEEVSGDIRKKLLDDITDERIRQQYEADKETKYKDKTLDDVKEQIRKDLVALVTDDAVKAEYEKNKAKYLITDDDKRYKPYEEVKEEIRKALEQDQMAEKAIAKIRALRDDVDALQIEDENAKIDLAALAAKHGLTYGKTGLFDEKHMTQVEEILGVSEDLKRQMMSIGDYGVGTIFDRMETTKGCFIVRIDEKVDSFVPPLTVPLRRRLARQLVHETAQRLAFRAAREFYLEARKRIDRAAEEWGKAHPEAPLEEKDKAMQAIRRDMVEILVAERGYSLVEGSPISRGGHAEAEMFDRPRYEIDLLPKQPKTVEEGLDEPASYEEIYQVAQLIDRIQPDGKDFETMKSQLKDQLGRKKRVEYLEKWLETVWEAAKLEDRLHAKPAGDETPPPDDNP